MTKISQEGTNEIKNLLVHVLWHDNNIYYFWSQTELYKQMDYGPIES